MSDLNFEAMPNKLVNYATLDGIAVIELASDAAGAALTEANDRSPNTYTHGMMSDLDDAIIKATLQEGYKGVTSPWVVQIALLRVANFCPSPVL